MPVQPANAVASAAVDVLIVGAGPVGLMTALEITILRPHTRIHLLEKHTHYSRSHVLQLGAHCLDTIPRNGFLGRLQDLLYKIVPVENRANWSNAALA